MNYQKLILLLLLAIYGCKKSKAPTNRTIKETNNTYDFVIAFGSCNNQNLDNNFWNIIDENNPNIWIWGGDIIYSDTYDMSYLEKNYTQQKNNVAYQNFIKNKEILATWDDHDYGLNDGGIEYTKKKESQQLFLDFLNVDKNDERRKQEGVYFAKSYSVNNTNIKIIALDTRYFRTELTPDTETKKRYQPNSYGRGSILGETQWKWLEEQLKNSKADYHILVSSIQFLSAEHGFESWGNMPHEVDKLEALLKSTQAKNTIILSGDRHISEFSKKEVDGLNYPLIDFTSSGLTHSYSGFTEEPNIYRVGTVVSKKSFGLLKFNFNQNKVIFEIKGAANEVYQTLTQNY